MLVQCVRPAATGDTHAISHMGRDYVKTLIDENPIQDWPAVTEELKLMGYDGWITVIENAWPQEQREMVAVRTAAHIRELWRGKTVRA